MQWLGRHYLNTHGNIIFNDDFVNLSVAFQVQVVVFCPGRMDVGVSITSTACITIDPFQPVLGTVSSRRLEIIPMFRSH